MGVAGDRTGHGESVARDCCGEGETDTPASADPETVRWRVDGSFRRSPCCRTRLHQHHGADLHADTRRPTQDEAGASQSRPWSRGCSGLGPAYGPICASWSPSDCPRGAEDEVGAQRRGSTTIAPALSPSRPPALARGRHSPALWPPTQRRIPVRSTDGGGYATSHTIIAGTESKSNLDFNIKFLYEPICVSIMARPFFSTDHCRVK